MNRWELLRQSIQELIQKYELKLYDLESSIDDCEKIKSFLDSYSKQNYDIKSLLNISKNSVFSDEVKNLIELIKTEIVIKNYAFLEKQYDEKHAEIEKNIQKLRSKYQQTNINNSRNNTYKEEYDFYTKIYSIIDNTGLTEVCSLEVLDFLIDKVEMLNIDDKEKELLVLELSQSNVALMKQNIDTEIKRNNTIKGYTKVIETEDKNSNITDIDYKSYIDNAKEIIEAKQNLNSEEVKLIQSQLKKCKSFEERKKLYSSTSDFDVCKFVISWDLENNILNSLNNDNYQLLISIIDYYNEICERERLINEVNGKSIYQLLEENHFSKELDLFQKSEEMSKLYNDFVANSYRYVINDDELGLDKIQIICKNLNDDIGVFKVAVKSYFENNKKDIEEFNFGCNCLLEKYNMAIEYVDVIKGIMSQDISNNKNQIHDNTEDNLLNKDNKSILIFISSDDNEVSTMERNLFEDKDRRYESFDAVKDGLNKLMKTGEMTADDHRAKTDNYSIDFIKKYRLKGYKCGNYRIITTRRNTCMGQVLKGFPENVFVNLIFSAGYGDCGGSQKEAVFDAGYKECYDNRGKVDEILELINTKWNELTDDTEKQQKLARLKEIMHHSQKMYDHFLNTGKEISDSRRGHNYEGID